MPDGFKKMEKTGSIDAGDVKGSSTGINQEE